MSIFDWVSRRVFNTVHRNNLVYNTCWEDPRLDRVALELGPQDVVMVITSAGCNALDYVLAGPRQIHAVDLNPRQNALLELKIAAIRQLEFDDFYRMFGQGRLPSAAVIYRQKLRPALSPWSQLYWDKKINWFDNGRKSFYYCGTSGQVARMMRTYTDRVIKVRPHLEQLLDAESIDRQREIYDRHIKAKFWSGLMKFTLNRDTTMSMLGVPRSQRRQIETQYEGGLVKYIQDCLEAVFAKLPMRDNYFWRVYLNGEYAPHCCPEYLKADNFERLKGGLLDRISVHTDSVQGFLEKHDGQVSRFILLDHMDWLSDHFFALLESEWQAIMLRADNRLIWRSGGLRADFIDQVYVTHNGHLEKLRPLLSFNTSLAEQLHPTDRVHTYGSFYIAKLCA